ncbi:sigma 54-interacting transcriptional regulator [Mesobacillus maritimus]|uniref:sigma-54 interaction domain-containing protein n=1 Tax=Mesobacillus maritimus TaxID=1643336 RepID=UPI00204102E7|nr:sigma 54-interacting transcriptional regulator [Mesobacillus maritimus]MCM3586724.1 sigma 54-interacting transcriptional regulator [Mesobacillus maritimus]MCM3668521.1 sigma 54-interacting transcriptional regulator [Mesobacillus maritimus]
MDIQYKNDILETIIDSAYEWIVVVDTYGEIVYMNKNYCQFLEIDRNDAIGKHVTEVIENSRMHIVATSGKEEIADLQYIKGNYMIANRIPIFSEGKLIGALGTVIFRDTKEWNKMNSHIKSLMPKLQTYLQDWDENSGAKYTLQDIKSVSQPITDLKEKVKNIASGDISVLIRGESGTGKELFAHSIHQLSARSHQPFIKVNCGAIPEHLLESELFGYEEGAFTGAKKGGKKGKFLLAHGGTIFLDEIGDMPLNMQVKLLRVLQEKEVEPVGSVKPLAVNVRVIAATNRPLEKMIEEKRFREDLFYRINVITLKIPPLRDRPEDIIHLTDYFLDKISMRAGKRITMIDEEVRNVFYQYNWPGNLRELENVIEAAVHLAEGDRITLRALPDSLTGDPKILIGQLSLKEILEETEKRIIVTTLEQVNQDKQKAAKALGISKSSMYEKIKKYALE